MGMIFLSNEDSDMNGLVAAWIKKQDPEAQLVLQRFIDEMFFRGVDWCMKRNDFVVETSLGIVNQHITSCCRKTTW